MLCVYTYIYPCIHVCTWMYIYTYNVCICTECIYIYTQKSMYASVYACINTHKIWVQTHIYLQSYVVTVNPGFYSHKSTFFSISLDELLKCDCDALIEQGPHHTELLTTFSYFSSLGFGSTFSAAEESVMMIPASPENISKQYKVSSQARTRYIY